MSMKKTQKRPPGSEKLEELVQILLVLQLFDMGASQDKIAKVVGRQKLWVNGILKGLTRKVANAETPRRPRKT